MLQQSDRQGMVVELRLQYFFEDSFETYLRCIFVEQERKFNIENLC